MSNDFLENYLTYCHGNEVPKSFHRWTGIAALSALVGRRVWLDFGLYQDHCNMYIVLVGKPADKKSTAMGIARKLIQQCDIQIAPASVTKQRIWELLDSKNKKSPYLSSYDYDGVTCPVAAFPMFCNEMVTMLSAGGDPLGMIEFLTDIWDRPFYDTDTKNAGSNVIDGPYITILGCMTPDQTGTLLKQDIITGGFSRRCILVTPDAPAPPVAFPEISDLQKQAWARCIDIGKELKEIKGPFTFDPAARDVYQAWYNKNSARQHEMNSPAVLYFYGSLPRYVSQVSMLLSLSRDRDCRTLTAATVSTAISWLEPLKDNLASVFAGAGSNPLSNISAKVELLLARSKRPMRFKEILMNLWDFTDQKQLTEVMGFLRDSGRVKEKFDTSSNPAVNLYFLPSPTGSAAPADHTISHTLPPVPSPNLDQMPSDDQPSERVASDQTIPLGPPPLGA